VLPGNDKHSRPHLPKNHGHFRSFQGHLSKNLPLHDISKHNHNKNKHNDWGRILSFFIISALNFWINHYKNYLNLSALLLLTATFTASVSHRKLLFYTACFELFSGGHSHLATLVFGKIARPPFECPLKY
jgi:hypothetical protein